MSARLLVLSGTQNPDSPNGRLAGEAARLLALTDVALTLVSLADYPLPLLDAEGPEGDLPENARLLAGRIGAQDGLLLVCPASVLSPSPLLLNALAWVVRAGEQPGERFVRPFARLVVGLASGSGAAGAAGLPTLRAGLTELDAEVLSRQCVVAEGDPFGRGGSRPGEASRSAASLEALVESLLDHTRALGRHL